MFDSDKYSKGHAHTCAHARTYTNTHLFLYIFSHRNSWSDNNYKKFVRACTWLMYTHRIGNTFSFQAFQPLEFHLEDDSARSWWKHKPQQLILLQGHFTSHRNSTAPITLQRLLWWPSPIHNHIADDPIIYDLNHPLMIYSMGFRMFFEGYILFILTVVSDIWIFYIVLSSVLVLVYLQYISLISS